MRKNLFNFNLDISPGKSGSLEGQITCEPCLSQCEKIKKKIGIDISAQPVEPIKKTTVDLPVKEETKTEEKKDAPVVQKKTETKTSDKK